MTFLSAVFQPVVSVGYVMLRAFENLFCYRESGLVARFFFYIWLTLG
jgi:hypothetical protein